MTNYNCKNKNNNNNQENHQKYAANLNALLANDTTARECFMSLSEGAQGALIKKSDQIHELNQLH